MGKKHNYKDKKRLDVDDRDAPAIYIDGDIYIGCEGQSHATLVQVLVNGMDFETNLNTLYDEIWNNSETDLHPEGINFFRQDIDRLEDEVYIFGHVLNNAIYWDGHSVDVVDKTAFKNKIRSTKSKYKHFMLRNDYTYYRI